MARNMKKKALYEVIIRAGSKTGYEQLHPKVGDRDPAVQQEKGTAPPPNVVRWVRKPSVVQFNAGRIEFSMPYQVGIAVLLGALLVVVVAFRLGERAGSPSTSSGQALRQDSGQASSARPISPQAGQAPKLVEPAPATAKTSPGQVATGRNRIVIQMYQVRSHLEPAKEYFDKLGVATEIIERSNWYYLVTKNGYDNPDKPGTDGFLAKQKIIELGAGYKAPAGYETFGPKPFKDAFGMRFEE
jgi:hypothetical protein